jgi:hypothetical protein
MQYINMILNHIEVVRYIVSNRGDLVEKFLDIISLMQVLSEFEKAYVSLVNTRLPTQKLGKLLFMLNTNQMLGKTCLTLNGILHTRSPN